MCLSYAGAVEPDSYQTWGKPGSGALMKNMSNRKSGSANRREQQQQQQQQISSKEDIIDKSKLCVSSVPTPTIAKEAGITCG